MKHSTESGGADLADRDHGEGERRRIGYRLISAGCLSSEQRDAVLMRQEELDARGQHLRFGDIAVQMGFCTRDQVESLPGYLGERLMQAGLLTREQRSLLVTWQEKLREKGIHIRFGDLAASEGICTASQIDAVISLDRPPTKH